MTEILMRPAPLPEPLGSQPQLPPFAFNPSTACSGALGLPHFHPMVRCWGSWQGAGASLGCPQPSGLVVNGG